MESMIAQRAPQQLTDEQRQILKGDPLRGISAYMSGTELHFYAPLVPGDRVLGMTALTAAQEKRSEFAERTVLTAHGTVYFRPDGAPVGLRNMSYVNAERATAAKKGKYTQIPEPHYDEDMLAEIDAAYAAEYVQGATPRYWEDVNVGDDLQRMVRGPLLVADMIMVHMMSGPGGYGALNSTRLAYKNRLRVPRFYSKNQFGAWDSAQRVHWDNDWARQTGHPRAFDYGYMRDNWAITMATNWAGDNSWLWKIRTSIRRFNYIGDTQWFTGKVVDKRVIEGLPVAVLGIESVNQRGEGTFAAEAEVILPRRGDGRVALPRPGDSPMDILHAVILR
jgi:acyl dehydratase